MSKTHLQLIEEHENDYLDALKHADFEKLKRFLHRDVLLTNAAGETSKGVGRHPMNELGKLKFYEIEVRDSVYSIYTSVALVNAVERRSGVYNGREFSSDYCMTRVWKFEEKRWQIIGIVAVHFGGDELAK